MFFKKLLFLFLLSAPVFSDAQSCITLRYFGFTIHPFGDDQASLQPYKVDKTAHLVLNFGGFAGYEKYVYEDMLSVKAMQGIFIDCSGGLAGFTHIGTRNVLLKKKKHRVMFGIGPTLYYREDWKRFPDYRDSKLFHRANTKAFGSVQYYLFWYGIELEYDYTLNDRTDFNFGFTPGAPLALTFSFGIKYWISKDFKIRERFVIPPPKKT